MSRLKTALPLLLCIGVAAPAAAHARALTPAWPGVTDVLLNLNMAAPVATVPAIPLPTWLGFTGAPASIPTVQGMWCGDLALVRLSAEFRRWDGTEDATTLAPPGISVYTKTVDIPDGCDTLYVTISATGDGHGGSQHLLTCLVDGAFCNPGGAFDGVPGWIALQRHGPTDDFHDNNVNYQWCTQVTPGTTVTVQIRLAKGDGLPFTPVFLQQEHFYIDASQTFGGCVPGSTD